MAQRPACTQPGEGPVDHAEEQQRQRLVELRRTEVGPQRSHGIGHGGDDAALGLEHALAFGRVQEFHVLGEHAVLVLRAGVGLHEAVDEFAQP